MYMRGSWAGTATTLLQKIVQASDRLLILVLRYKKSSKAGRQIPCRQSSALTANAASIPCIDTFFGSYLRKWVIYP